MNDYLDLLTELATQHVLPEGCDAWGFRTRAAGNGFQYPQEGWATAPGPFLEHDGVSPTAKGDGICIAYTWAGLATIKVPSVDLLLVAYATEDRLSRPDPNTARLRRLYVVAPINGLELVHQRGMGANLHGANFGGCDLRGAELFGADLSDANLERANLDGATLYAANLRGARMLGARLDGTNLRLADLEGAVLTGAGFAASTLVEGANLHAAHEPNGRIFRARFR